MSADPAASAGIAALLRAARDAWPEIVLSDSVFVAHVVDVLPEDVPMADGLVGVCGDDLYLACACVHGDRAAVRMIESRYLRPLYASLGAEADEVMQRVRMKLLGSGASPPKLLDFRGEGSLHSWLRVVVMREAQSLGRGKIREVATDDMLLAALPDDADDPELQHVKQRYRDVFKVCVEDAFARRTPRERNLLRQHVLDGLTVDQLGAVYHVHRATAARWVADARRAIFEDTRALLQDRLQLSTAEFQSLLRVVRSQLDLSLHRLLR